MVHASAMETRSFREPLSEPSCKDLKFRGEESTAEIGDNNLIRENVTVNRGTAAKGRTIVGKQQLINGRGACSTRCTDR